MQVLKREPALEKHYSQSLKRIQRELSGLLRGSTTQLPDGVLPPLSQDATMQSAGVSPAPLSVSQQASASDQVLPGNSSLDKFDGTRGSSGDDSDTGDDMELDDTPPLPSNASRYAFK